MRLQHTLSVVTPTLDGDVLTTLARASKPFTTADLHRTLGRHSPSGIRKVLHRLEAEGIVDPVRLGNVTAYQLNRDHLAVPAILALADLRHTYIERLRDTFTAWTPAPVFAAMFGSAARGEMKTTSDVDLFVVRSDELDDLKLELWWQNLQELQRSASRWTGNDVRTLVMSESDVVANLNEDPVLTSIRYDEVVLHGSSGFWRRVYAENRRLHASDA